MAGPERHLCPKPRSEPWKQHADHLPLRTHTMPPPPPLKLPTQSQAPEKPLPQVRLSTPKCGLLARKGTQGLNLYFFLLAGLTQSLSCPEVIQPLAPALERCFLREGN